MRVFVAVELSPEAAEHLSRALPRDITLRWQAITRWHITLAFLGEVTAERLRVASPRFAHVAESHEPFTCRIHGAGLFGRTVLWAGVDGSLSALAEGISGAARATGIPVEHRRFTPHVTLARIRPHDPDPEPARDALSGYTGPPWTVDDIVVMRSHTGPQPSYEVLERLPLGHRHRVTG